MNPEATINAEDRSFSTDGQEAVMANHINAFFLKISLNY